MSSFNQLFKMAVLAGVESAVQLHLNRGDDLNARDSNGMTLLMLAAAKNKSTICQMLLNAGADITLLDPIGRDAHTIAVSAGAHEAANLLRIPTSGTDSSKQLHSTKSPVIQLGDDKDNELFRESKAVSGETSAEIDATDLNVFCMFEIVDEIDDFDIDALKWESEEVPQPPETDSFLVSEVSAVQAAISAHIPFDSSSDWDDVDIFLPDQATPSLRSDDAEARKNLRLLLLRAYREGSVPSLAVESLAMYEAGALNLEFEAIVTKVVNDLGAEIDERFEYVTANEDFTVFVSSQETEEEEELVDSGLYNIDCVMSRRFEPTRIYLSNIQKIKLLTGEDEIVLAQRMELERSRALDALACWPKGIAKVLAAGRSVYEKKRTLLSVSMGPRETQTELNDVVEEPVSVSDEGSDEINELLDDSVESSSALPIFFFDALHSLSELEQDLLAIEAKNEIYGLLELLRLSTAFLLELSDMATNEVCMPSREFVSAMSSYLDVREQMMTANLKLAHHIAKKFLYSGEPLDDLVQEANIGLMKAVERFDWRRGFKFSTYAIWWIRQQAWRYIADSTRTIRIPVHVHEKLQRLSREKRTSEIQTGRPPEPEEIIKRLGISLQSLEMLERIPLEFLSFDHEFDDQMIDAVASNDYTLRDPLDSCVELQFQRIMNDVVSSLDLREEKVIRLRFGIGTSTSFTLEEIGEIYEVTRERIRQIEAKALRKLRHPSRSNKIKLAFLGTTDETKESSLLVDDSGAPVRATVDIVVERSNDNASQISVPDLIKENQATKDVDSIPDLHTQTQETPEFVDGRSPSTTKQLDHLLSKIRESGVYVLDNRNSPSGKIWVDIADISDTKNRAFIRKLVDAGFEFRPGLGCWRTC